jgi:hypothetical protein
MRDIAVLAQVLAHDLCRVLVKLDLRYTARKVRVRESFAVTLSSLPIRSCSIGDEGAAAIFRGLAKNKSITDLNLQSVTLGHFGVKSLQHALSQNSTLTKLNLWGCGLGDARSELLFPGLEANKGLKEVSAPCFCPRMSPVKEVEQDC